MFVKLTIFVCSLAAVLAQYHGPQAGGTPAAQYPAGVDPQSCPNYPDCSSPLVAVQSGGNHQYQAQPQYQPQYQQAYSQPQSYQQPQYQPQYQQAAPQAQQYNSADQDALNRGEYIGDGDYHGEGLAEALAPGYSSAPQQYSQPAPIAPQYSQYQQPAARAYNPAPVATQYNQAPLFNPSAASQYNQAPVVPSPYQARAYSPESAVPAYQGGAQPAQIPAGVDPSSCPNYPFCHA